MIDHTTGEIVEDDAADRQMFSEWLAAHRAGALDDQLTAALREVAEQVQLEVGSR